ncbi:MAG: RNB domain-containing ribonuclease, partial [Pseudomonadota bacterium]
SCSDALNNYRQQHQLVMENRPDFMLVLNNDGKLDHIEKLERSLAHKIVEEAMLATNKAAGEFLALHQAGLFNVHPGYKAERRDDIEDLLKEKLARDDIGDTGTLEGYIKLIKELQNKRPELIPIQQRFLQGSEPSLEAKPHFGLGVKHYATITSPIRRYQDLFNQRCIHQLLINKKATKFRKKQLSRLKEILNNNRNAARSVEQWLVSDYLSSHIGQTFKAQVALLTNQGIGVRLKDTGIEGFILGRKEVKQQPEIAFDKISFNNQRMELTWNGQAVALEQELDVVLTDIDMEKKKPVFEWKHLPSSNN